VQYGRGLPVAETIPNDLIMIRMHPNLTEEDVEDIAHAVRKVIEYYLQHQEDTL
jgi:dTDP-4-amino-4,6-dideoxygalactose transaminase